jgi:hypothetical protein
VPRDGRLVFDSILPFDVITLIFTGSHREASVAGVLELALPLFGKDAPIDDASLQPFRAASWGFASLLKMGLVEQDHRISSGRAC